MLERIGLVLAGVADTTREGPLVRQLVVQVDELGFILVRVEIVGDEVRQDAVREERRQRCRERVEIRRIVVAILGVVIEGSRRPVQRVRERSASELEFGRVLPVLLLVGSLCEAEGSQVAVVDPVRLIRLVRENQLGVNLLRDAVVRGDGLPAIRGYLLRVVLLSGHDIAEGGVVVPDAR